MDAKKIKNFDKITPVFAKGELPDGKKIGGQGTAPWKVMFLEGPTSTMVVTVVLSVLCGLAYRKRFVGANLLFYVTVASLIVPSIVTLLGIALQFRLLDDFLKSHGPGWMSAGFTTTMGLFTSGLGAHLTWTLLFGLLVMFTIFNRFDSWLEEAARDLGLTPWQTFWHVIVPIISPSVVGLGLFGFTLSWDEIARSSQAIGEHNTLSMELQGLTTTGTTPEIYALGTATTGVLFVVIARG
jgi:putative spermidine/putrescine transport system permease protein